MEFFINKYTHLLKPSYLWPQGLQNEALQQRYSPCKSKNPISREELKIISTKIQISIKFFYPEWFGQKQSESIRLWNGFHDKSTQTDGSKEM